MRFLINLGQLEILSDLFKPRSSDLAEWFPIFPKKKCVCEQNVTEAKKIKDFLMFFSVISVKN